MNSVLSIIRSLNQRSLQSYGEDIGHASEALALATRLGDQVSIAESTFVIGQCLIIRGRTRDALPYLNEARDLFASLPDDPVLKNLESPLQIAIALLRDDLCDPEGALRHCEEAYRLSQVSGHSPDQQGALLYLGYAHYKLGHGELAIDYMMETLRHPGIIPVIRYMTYDFIADLMEQQGLWAAVLKQRLRALEHLPPKDRFRAARVRCGIARCLLNMNRMDEAWRAIELAEAAIAHFKEPIRATGRVQEAKAMYFLRLKDFASASHFQDLTRLAFESCGSTQFVQDAALLKAEIELAEGRLTACQVTCNTLHGEPLSFHRRLALDRLREKLCCASGNWAEAYQLHLKTEAVQMVDLGITLERKEEIHRMELDNLKNQALLEKNQQLEQMATEREDLMHLVVHDMANYLQVTRNSMEVVKRVIEDPAPRISVSKQALVERSLSSLDMIDEVLGQLRLLWQVDSHPLSSVQMEVVAIAPIIEHIAAQYALWAREKRQTLSVEIIDRNIHCLVNTQHLSQIMANLVSNAIKYSEPGTLTKVTLSKNASGNMAQIQIEDQGQGMSEEDLTVAFQRFRRLSAKPTGGEPSNGLGLYLVKRLAEPMRGELAVRSPGKNLGTVFTIQLPLAKMADVPDFKAAS